jgi:dTDP-4-dehydrorhamnose 3,5-epimerase-like enzyme
MIKLSNYQLIQGKIIKHPKGNILKTLDSKNINFKKIKEIYFSWVANKKIKAWKYHKKMMIFVAVPHGSVKFVFFNIKKKKFQSIIIGEKNYQILRIKPKTWFGFQGVSKNKSLIMSCTTLVHLKKEILRKKITDLKYKW